MNRMEAELVCCFTSRSECLTNKPHRVPDIMLQMNIHQTTCWFPFVTCLWSTVKEDKLDVSFQLATRRLSESTSGWVEVIKWWLDPQANLAQQKLNCKWKARTTINTNAFIYLRTQGYIQLSSPRQMMCQAPVPQLNASKVKALPLCRSAQASWRVLMLRNELSWNVYLFNGRVKVVSI